MMASRGASLTKNDLYGALEKTQSNLEARGMSPDNPIFGHIDNAVAKVNSMEGDTITLSQAREIKNDFFKKKSSTNSLTNDQGCS
jgi:hypothetical protein